MMSNLKAGIGSAYAAARYARAEYRRSIRYQRLIRQRNVAFAAYRNHSPRCLHLGAQNFVLSNWFNTDLEPVTEGVYYVDATQPLPFPDGSFDFVFSEHMIEHIPFVSGLRLLAECRRVLKPSGVVRIATPNLRNILGLIADHHPDIERYLHWAVQTFGLPTQPFPKAPMVINNFFRSWGHQFVYDPETLGEAMAQAGLRDIVQLQPGISSYAQLSMLEHHGQAIGEWTNEFETMVFEGSAP